MITTNAYLNFTGNCEEAFKTYEKILGGKIIAMLKARGSPMEGHVPADFLDKIMHARMSVGTTVIMGSDSPSNQSKPPQGFAVSIGVDTPAEADRIYAALAQGGKEAMPIAETFWAHRFGMCTDRFGIPWMVNCEKPMLGRNGS
jgi:PhnB protein